jgi:hypothetical protein
VVLLGHVHLAPELPGGAPAPGRGAQQLPAQQHGVGLTVGEDLLGLLGLGAQTHRRDGHPRLVPDAVGERNLPVTKSTTTHHFRVLRESGVIRQVHRGTAKMKGLRRDDLDGLFPGLLDALLDAAARQAARIRDLGDG